MKKHQGRKEILFLSAKHFLRTSVHLLQGSSLAGCEGKRNRSGGTSAWITAMRTNKSSSSPHFPMDPSPFLH